MLFVFLISIIGLSLVFRIFQFIGGQNLFEKCEMTIFGTAYFFCFAVLLFVFPRSRIALWIALFLPLSILLAVIFYFVKKRAHEFRHAVSEAMTLTLIKMKTGKSFRQSFSEIIPSTKKRMRTKLIEINSAVVFSQQMSPSQFDPFIAEVVDEFIRIDQHPHAAIRRLSVFRDKIRLEDDFRRRSGQVLSRIRAQSVVMMCLYIAVAAFMLIKFGFQKNAKLIAISVALFLLGSAWLWIGGRRLRWRV